MVCSGIVTLTTDFGLADSFVGQMHGKVLSVLPEATVVDLTHQVPPHDVVSGSFLLETGYAAFPVGTVHVAVVDPGVGTERRPIVARTGRHVFVAPDNGLLTRVLAREPALAAYTIDPRKLAPGDVSATFHGRDLFAPAAARIAGGTDPEELGDPAGALHTLALDRATPRPGATLRVRVLWIDRFGNATLDLPRSRLEPVLRGLVQPLRTIGAGGEARGLRRTYADSRGGGPCLLFNSSDYLEIAEYGADAASRLGLRVGDAVEVLLPER